MTVATKHLKPSTPEETVSWERLRPWQKKGIDAHAVQHEMVLYDPERGIGFSLNLSARAVWELCDGSHTIREISARLAHMLEEDEASLFPDVQSAVQQLYECDLLTLGAVSTS